MMIEEMLNKMEMDQQKIWDFIYPDQPSTKEQRIALLRQLRGDIKKDCSQEKEY